MQTGVFEKEKYKIHCIDIGDGREIRYETSYQLGHIVAFNNLRVGNPFDPGNTDYDSFHEGYYAGKAKRLAATPCQPTES